MDYQSKQLLAVFSGYSSPSTIKVKNEWTYTSILHMPSQTEQEKSS